MRSFLDPKVLARLAPLPLKARGPMLGNVSGKHRSPIRGSSVEFASYRKYVPGDDTRRLDWRAYGRTDRFYIKEFEADTNLRLCLIVDTSGSMQFPVGTGMSKLEYAKRVAGTLAYHAAAQGDAVGLYCAGRDFTTQIPPKRNSAHLRSVFDHLDAIEAEGETGLADVLHSAAERIAQRALIVIVSDLFLQPSVLGKCFQHMRFRKHDVAVFHLLDRAELEFEFDRPMRFLDLEGNAHILADPSIIAKEYRHSVNTYLTSLTEVTRDAAVDYHRVMLEEPYDQVLAKFLVARA